MISTGTAFTNVQIKRNPFFTRLILIIHIFFLFYIFLNVTVKAKHKYLYTRVNDFLRCRSTQKKNFILHYRAKKIIC